MKLNSITFNSQITKYKKQMVKTRSFLYGLCGFVLHFFGL